MNQEKEYDLIIVGGGMVGAGLACALGDTPLRVAVIESREPALSWPPEDYDIRVSAITRASQRFFENVGAWEGMVSRRVHAYSDMHVWDATGSGVIHFDSADIGEPDLGHIIENSVIQAALVERARRFDNIDYRCPMELREVQWQADAGSVTSAGGETLSARLLVGADGGRSWLRGQAGIQVKGWSYDQSAVVCTVQTEQSHEDTCWQRFMPSGPLAFLPMDENRSSIVWSTTPEQARSLLDLDEADFRRLLGDALENRLGRVVSVGERGAFPLRLQHAEHYVMPRLALVGDAAHTIHPLAGQGVNLGLADAATLAQVLLEARQAREDLGDMKVLRRYERWRKADNLTMMAAMDGFKRLFSNDLLPLRWARNLGLNLTNGVLPLKNLLIRYAMGLTGTLPNLARRRAG
jgi:2-octaprenylphenol hydroxylase